MKKKTYALLFLSFILLSPHLYSTILVDVTVSGVIDGHISYIRSEELLVDKPQEFLMELDNTGSVGCGFRIRIDIYNGSQMVYTAWSKEVPLEPGSHSDFRMYFYPPYPGDFKAKVFVYSCNLITEGPVLNFTVIRPEMNVTFAENTSHKSLNSKETGKKEDEIFEISAVNNRNSVEMKIKSKRNVTDLVIIPKEYPMGWIFESGRINEINEGEEKTVRIGYVAGIWKEREIAFDLVTLDGKYHIKKSIMLRDEEEDILERFTIPALEMIILILLAITVYLLKERRKTRKFLHSKNGPD